MRTDKEIQEDNHAARAQAGLRWTRFLDKADSIHDTKLRKTCASWIESAMQNATDTIDLDGVGDDSDWSYYAKTSLEVLMDCSTSIDADDSMNWIRANLSMVQA